MLWLAWRGVLNAWQHVCTTQQRHVLAELSLQLLCKWRLTFALTERLQSEGPAFILLAEFKNL